MADSQAKIEISHARVHRMDSYIQVRLANGMLSRISAVRPTVRPANLRSTPSHNEPP